MGMGPMVASLPNANWSGTTSMQGIGGKAGAAMGGGGLGGIASLLGPAGLSFLPGLLSSVFGGESPEQKMRRAKRCAALKKPHTTQREMKITGRLIRDVSGYNIM